MSVSILHGDCRELMAAMPDASVDAVVCDPPYHLTTGKKGGSGPASVNLESPYGRARVTTGFMGMTWDGGNVAQSVEMWAECLRVLKPGGHVLAFSGTRTYHRMVCAIEDAGFEIRDQIGWCFASGFPKSHNLDNLRGELTCGCNDHLHGVRQGTNHASGVGAEGQDSELQQAVQRSAARARMGTTRPQGRCGTQDLYADDGGQESGLEGRSDCLQEEGQLQGHSLPARAGVDEADGPQGRLHHGAQDGDGGVVRLPVDADRSGASRQPRPDTKRADEFGAVAGQPEPQIGGAWPVCGGCGKPILPKGLGTALKPAWEPIVLARKPLIGTVAANVLQHGTGALNIDGCRIEGESTIREKAAGRGQFPHEDDAWEPKAVTVGSDVGRWPANLIHDGSPEVVALFPADAPSGGHVSHRNVPKSKNAFGDFGTPAEEFVGYPDSGSAARFFYAAKASQEDRNEGCNGLPERTGGMVSNTSGQHITRRDGGAPGPRANHHPTVKPTDLMRWLVRLVTPKGGVVLDPFMGSGSTGKAAVLEGFRFIGMELSAEYIEIARARIEFAQRMGHQPSLLEAA